jgi:hypothetical protein
MSSSLLLTVCMSAELAQATWVWMWFRHLPWASTSESVHLWVSLGRVYASICVYEYTSTTVQYNLCKFVLICKLNPLLASQMYVLSPVPTQWGPWKTTQPHLESGNVNDSLPLPKHIFITSVGVPICATVREFANTSLSQCVFPQRIFFWLHEPRWGVVGLHGPHWAIVGISRFFVAACAPVFVDMSTPVNDYISAGVRICSGFNKLPHKRPD